MGIPVNRKPERAVQAKIRDKKNCTPGKLKTRKGDLRKKGFPGGSKTRKGDPGKSQGIKAYDYVLSDHFKDNPFTDKLQASDKSNHPRTKQEWTDTQSCEGYSRMGTPWNCYTQPSFCINFFSIFTAAFSYQDVCLPCTKILTKINTNILQSTEICLPFFFFLHLYFI